MPNKTNKRPIDIEEGRKIFNNYYEHKHKGKPRSIYTSKLFDALYEKKQKYTVEPNSKDSWKYGLKDGVKTFDMKGVDSFTEGTSFTLHGKNKISKGSSSKKINDDPRSNSYGPRGKEGELYSEKFRKKYATNQIKLVDIYWKRFNNRKGIRLIVGSFTGLTEEEKNKTVRILKKHSIKYDNDLHNLNKNIFLQLNIEDKIALLLDKEVNIVKKKINDKILVEPRKNKHYSKQLSLLIKKQRGEKIVVEDTDDESSEDDIENEPEVPSKIVPKVESVDSVDTVDTVDSSEKSKQTKPVALSTRFIKVNTDPNTFAIILVGEKMDKNISDDETFMVQSETGNFLLYKDYYNDEHQIIINLKEIKIFIDTDYVTIYTLQTGYVSNIEDLLGDEVYDTAMEQIDTLSERNWLNNTNEIYSLSDTFKQVYADFDKFVLSEPSMKKVEPDPLVIPVQQVMATTKESAVLSAILERVSLLSESDVETLTFGKFYKMLKVEFGAEIKPFKQDIKNALVEHTNILKKDKKIKKKEEKPSNEPIVISKDTTPKNTGDSDSDSDGDNQQDMLDDLGDDPNAAMDVDNMDDLDDLLSDDSEDSTIQSGGYNNEETGEETGEDTNDEEIYSTDEETYSSDEETYSSDEEDSPIDTDAVTDVDTDKEIDAVTDEDTDEDTDEEIDAVTDEDTDEETYDEESDDEFIYENLLPNDNDDNNEDMNDNNIKKVNINKKNFEIGKNLYTFHVSKEKLNGAYNIYAGKNILGYRNNDIIGEWKNNKPNVQAIQFAKNIINLYN